MTTELTDAQILAVFRTAANPDKNIALEFGRALIAAHESQRQAYGSAKLKSLLEAPDSETAKGVY